ncbi:hypothetical protein GGI13_001737 [Coemansia sp. RSA 455]|nr:hypothetical protein LPJ71_000680 [Coemansia sp. S17]KAJ2073856.1 hypothetical protein GGH13_001715 [Coemansia sp. S155-1]KAJ2103804.1 hypothetical protein GGI09_000474 [Coemansia sp. S100]KAJ2255194.1 hypothetical protein GGI13_001737 [Coemansia sp. RSA 455]
MEIQVAETQPPAGLPVKFVQHAQQSRTNLQLAAEFRTLSIQLSEGDERRNQRLRNVQGFLKSPRWRELFNEIIPLRSAYQQRWTDEQQRSVALTKIAEHLRSTTHHIETVNDTYVKFNTSPTIGLEAEAVKRRVARDGLNVVSARPRLVSLKLVSWFFGGFNRFLWVSMIAFWLCWQPIGNPPQTGNLALAVVILFVICLQALFSAWQEWITSRALDSITNMLPAGCTVLRDGQQQKVAGVQLVAGDIVTLRAGDRVPADMRLVSVSLDLLLDRSVLTGAANPTIGTVNYTNENYLETRNMAMMGANVTQGQCTGVVVATGDRSVLGRVTQLTLRKKAARTILQIEVHRLVNGLTTVSLVVGALFILLWAVWLRTSYPGFMSVSDALANGFGVLVTFVPGSLPISLTLALTAIAKRMQRHNMLIKNLTTVETLGTVNVICCEKTGTLTQRNMAVTHIAYADQECLAARLMGGPVAAARLYETAALCNDAVFDPETAHLLPAERTVSGDATDCALLRLAAEIHSPASDVVRLLTIPFSLRRRYMLTVCKQPGGQPYVLIKGAPETLFSSCTLAQTADGTLVPFDAALRTRMENTQARWAVESGCRALLLCRREFPPEDNPLTGLEDNPAQMYTVATQSLSDLCIVGLVGMVDPPRTEIPSVVDTFRGAGIRVFMVTGDYAPTAAFVARQCRIITGSIIDSIEDALDRAQNNLRNPVVDEKPLRRFASRLSNFGNQGAPQEELCKCRSVPASLALAREESLAETAVGCRHSLVVSGPDLEGLRAEHWDAICSYEEIVFARIRPDQKLQIVEELTARSNYVAVTGDDVNDLPAMRAAHVGVAMGNGSEVAKEVADMVLLDNNFSSIVTAIECGRLVFANLKKVIIYLLPMTNLSEIVPSMFNVVLGLPIPLSTFLMLVINTITDVWASTMLIHEEPEHDILLHPPRDPQKESLVDLKFFMQAYGFIGVIETVTGHFMFFLSIYLQSGIGPSSIFMAFNRWSDGYMGYSKAQLAEFVSVAGSVHFMALVTMQWGNMFAARTRTLSIVQQNPLWGPKCNPLLLVAIPISVAVALFVNEIPWFNEVFLTGRIPVEFFFLPIPFAVFLVAAEEARKYVVRRYPTSVVATLAW